MKLPYYVIDAFASKPFSGNPAGVCPLEEWLPDDVMQKIAMENNLSETAFFVSTAPAGSVAGERPNGDKFHLRWFAPTAEVDLCGHATLASAFVLFELLGHSSPAVHFETKSGPLTVSRQTDYLAMDFPMLKLTSSPIARDLVEGLGVLPRDAFSSMDEVAIFDDAETVRNLKPNLDVLKRLPGRGVIATAPGKGCDYVLRCFAPKVGIAEDPVTGSAQCQIAAYWSETIGKKTMTVQQLSARGGEMVVEVAGDCASEKCRGGATGRVKIGGQASLYLKGEIHL